MGTEYEVTASVEGKGVQVLTVEADSPEAATEKVRQRDDVVTVEEELTVGFERNEDGKRVY